MTIKKEKNARGKIKIKNAMVLSGISKIIGMINTAAANDAITVLFFLSMKSSFVQ